MAQPAGIYKDEEGQKIDTQQQRVYGVELSGKKLPRPRFWDQHLGVKMSEVPGQVGQETQER